MNIACVTVSGRYEYLKLWHTIFRTLQIDLDQRFLPSLWSIRSVRWFKTDVSELLIGPTFEVEDLVGEFEPYIEIDR